MTTLDRQSGLGRWLNIIGPPIVALFLTQQFVSRSIGPAPLVLTSIALAGWLALLFLPRRGGILGRSIMLVTAATAGIAAAPTNGLAIVPVIMVTITALADLAIPVWFGALVGVVGVALVAAGSLAVTITVVGVLSLEAGVVVGLLAGYARRQLRTAERQNAELTERTAAMREEHARAALLASRQSLARDIHDVLAHSLGGLVIQLDAVDALIEADRVGDAKARLEAARSLARDGLADARRAVDALRDPAAERVAAPLAVQLQELVAAHRAIVGDEDACDLTQHGAPRPVDGGSAEAFRRLVQEALSNARKHAPGERVAVGVTWPSGAGELAVTVTNGVTGGARVGAVAPLSAIQARTEGYDTRNGRGSADTPPVDGTPALATSGGGHGLAGMAERFARLPGGGVDSGFTEVDGHPAFSVSARAALASPSQEAGTTIGARERENGEAT